MINFTQTQMKTPPCHTSPELMGYTASDNKIDLDSVSLTYDLDPHAL